MDNITDTDIAEIETRAKEMNLIATQAGSASRVLGVLAITPKTRGGLDRFIKHRVYMVEDLQPTVKDIAALIARVRELERALHCDLCGASLLRGCISCGHIRDEEEI